MSTWQWAREPDLHRADKHGPISIRTDNAIQEGMLASPSSDFMQTKYNQETIILRRTDSRKIERNCFEVWALTVDIVYMITFIW